MSIENKVISLDRAKRLVELGFKRDSCAYWVITLSTEYHISYYDELPTVLKERNDVYPAYDCDELLGFLPANIKIYKTKTGYSCSNWHNPRKNATTIRSDTPANALCDMLIDLIIEEKTNDK
jgi:hypothetical protein